MRRSHGFTLIELLVVIAIIAVLMGVLMPALSRIRAQAKTVACQASLKQWGLIWAMYTEDNNGCFIRGAGGESQTGANQWVTVMRSQYQNLKMRTCPMAPKPLGNPSPFSAWGPLDDDSIGSYGLNEWVSNRPASEDQGGNYWRSIYNKPADQIPVFLDCYWYDVWPHANDNPPQNPDDVIGTTTDEMKRVCLDRHNGVVNCVFLDWSIRKVGLKELWTLKWHKNFNTRGAWTLAGGATAEKWPDWMRQMKDY